VGKEKGLRKKVTSGNEEVRQTNTRKEAILVGDIDFFSPPIK
jgi:hypothetical protein